MGKGSLVEKKGLLEKDSKEERKRGIWRMLIMIESWSWRGEGREAEGDMECDWSFLYKDGKGW